MSNQTTEALAPPGDSAALVEAAVQAVERRLGITKVRWATVTSWDPTNDALGVRVDGDPQSIQVVNATGLSFVEEQRVLVQYLPPHGALVIGCKPAPPIQWVPEWDNVTIIDGTSDGQWYASGPLVHYAAEFVLGASDSVTGVIGIVLPTLGSEVITTASPWLTMGRAFNGSARHVGAGVYDPGTSYEVVTSFGSDGGGLWTTTVPFTWAPGDTLRVTGSYPRRLPSEDPIGT